MSKTPLGQMIVEMGLDDTNFSKGVTATRKQLTALKNDLKTSQSVTSAFGGGLNGVAKPTEVLTKMIQTQRKELNHLNDSYKNSFNDGKASANTSRYASEISRANANLALYAGQLKEAVAAEYMQASALPKISSGLGMASSGFGKLSRAVLPASIAMTATFYKGIQDATAFNGQMSTIQALLRDTTPAQQLGKQMDVLGEKSKTWARQYGVSTESINTGIEEMVKKGYDFNQTLGAMPAVLDASKASGDDFNIVMSASTSILEQFGLKSSNTSKMLTNTQRVTDSLTFVANKTAAGFSDMGNAMEYVGPVAHALGMSVEETSAAVGLLSNNGIEGEKAGTALRGALSRLLKPTKQSTSAFKELGINISDFKKGNLTLPDIIDKIQKSTQGLTAAQKSSLLAMAFGTEAQTGMNILVSQGGDELRKLTAETKNATGYTKGLADEMNKSDKNAFARAKATIETMSITLGQKLLPNIIPVLKEVDNLADSFNNLSPKAKNTLINMGLIAAAAYPVSKALSTVTGAGSAVFNSLSKLGAKGAGILALKGITTEAGGASAAIGSGGLATEIGGLSPILAGLGPVAVGALGAAGLAGLIYGVTKEVDKLLDKNNLFGTINVPDETYKQVSDFRDTIGKAKIAMDEFGTGSENSVKKVKAAVKSLANDTKDDIDKATKQLEEAMKRTGYTSEQIAEMKSRGDQAKKVVQAAADDISQVYINANKRDKNNRELTVDEQAKVSASIQVIFESEADALKISGEKKNNLMRALNDDFNNMSKKQARQVISDMRDMREQANNEYEQQAADQKKLLDGHIISQDTYNENMAAAENERVDKLGRYGKAVAKAEEIVKGNLELGMSGYKEWRQNAEAEMGLYGESLDKALAKAGDSSKKLGDSGQILAKYTKDMTDDAKKADDAWNGMIFEPKTGEIKTNAPQAIAKALTAKGGWDDMQFILKNANLTSNARMTVAEALISNGQWNSMTPTQKNLVVNNHQGLQAIADSKTNMQIWNKLPVSVKNMLGNNKDFLDKKGVATTMLQSWNSMPTSMKKMLAENKDFINKKGAAEGVLNSWNGLTVKQKDIIARDKSSSVVKDIKGQLNSIPEKKTTTWDFFANLSSIPGKLKNMLGLQTGTPYHTGGIAMVNDQKGPVYKELITLPNGQSFVPQGRDVILPLPRGTQVLKASQTAKMIPKYAQGVGNIPSNSRFLQEVRSVKQNFDVSLPQNDSEVSSKQIEIVISLLKTLVAKESLTISGNNTQGQMTARKQNQAINNLQGDLAWLLSNN